MVTIKILMEYVKHVKVNSQIQQLFVHKTEKLLPGVLIIIFYLLIKKNALKLFLQVVLKLIMMENAKHALNHKAM